MDCIAWLSNLACGYSNEFVNSSLCAACILPWSHKMVFIFILATDTRSTTQGACIQRAVQLSNAISTGPNSRRWWYICRCTAGGKDEERSKQSCNLSPARSTPLLVQISANQCKLAWPLRASRVSVPSGYSHSLLGRSCFLLRSCLGQVTVAMYIVVLICTLRHCLMLCDCTVYTVV